MAEKRFLSGAEEVPIPSSAVNELTTNFDRSIRHSSGSLGKWGRAVDVISHHLVVGFADKERKDELLLVANADELVIYRRTRNPKRAKLYKSVGPSESGDTLMHSTLKTLMHPILVFRSFPLSGKIKESRLFAVKAEHLRKGQDKPPRRIRVMSETKDLSRPHGERKLPRAT